MYNYPHLINATSGKISVMISLVLEAIRIEVKSLENRTPSRSCDITDDHIAYLSWKDQKQKKKQQTNKQR